MGVVEAPLFRRVPLDAAENVVAPAASLVQKRRGLVVQPVPE
jgi:hypothetical protein